MTYDRLDPLSLSLLADSTRHFHLLCETTTLSDAMPPKFIFHPVSQESQRNNILGQHVQP